MKTIILLFLISVTICVEALAQVHKYCGTYMPYDTVGLSKANVPVGYQVCLINHVTRHGSRYPVSDKVNVSLINLLEAQRTNNNLTDSGEALLEMLLKQNKLYIGNWGRLTEVGYAQQCGIARRLIQEYGSDVFKSLVVWVDAKERCQQSCEAFLRQIVMTCPECANDKTVAVLPLHNSLLNFFETNADYLEFKTHASWTIQFEDFKKEVLKNNRSIDRYLLDLSNVTLAERINFLVNLYSVVAIASDIPLSNNLIPFVNEDDMRMGWIIQNAHQYMEKGPYAGFNQLQINISKPLLRNFIKTTDAGLMSNVPTSYLRFAHAETVIPFAALLGIPQASQVVSTPNDIAAAWKDYEVSPMAANIVWVICKNSDNHFLVKMMLNEHDVSFPLESVNYPWYNWSEVRDYYLRLLNQ